jgi:hypothetical protein
MRHDVLLNNIKNFIPPSTENTLLLLYKDIQLVSVREILQIADEV